MEIQADYSCYIRLNNKTDVDFSLIDTLVVSGKWPEGQPANAIEANSSVDLRLKDPAGTTGAEGSVACSLELKKYPDMKITFKLDFYCTVWSVVRQFLGRVCEPPGADFC